MYLTAAGAEVLHCHAGPNLHDNPVAAPAHCDRPNQLAHEAVLVISPAARQCTSCPPPCSLRHAGLQMPQGQEFRDGQAGRHQGGTRGAGDPEGHAPCQGGLLLSHRQDAASMHLLSSPRLGSLAVCVDCCMTADCAGCCARLLQPAAACTHLLPGPQDSAELSMKCLCVLNDYVLLRCWFAVSEVPGCQGVV